MRIACDGSTTDACKTQAEAIAKQEGRCPLCDLTGLVTIYHKNYDGKPTITVKNHNGEVREARARVAAHCSCEVGKWIRSCTAPDALPRIPQIRDILTGTLKNWSPIDPTEPECDDMQEPNWKDFRRWLAEHDKPLTKPILRPKAPGNREAARREMDIAQANAMAVAKAVQPVQTVVQREPGED